MSVTNGFHLFGKGSISAVEVPQQLEPIGQSDQWIIGSLLLLTFILIALSKRVEETSLLNAVRLFFSSGTIGQLQKLDIRLSSPGTILLSVNFVLSLWVCLILFAKTLFDKTGMEVILVWTALGALVFVLYQFVGLFVVAWVTGEYANVRVPILQTFGSLPFTGMLFFAMALIWFLNPLIHTEMFFIFGYTFLGIVVLRILKTLFGAIGTGIPWYYIILYFCTLEILPVFVIYYYLK